MMVAILLGSLDIEYLSLRSFMNWIGLAFFELRESILFIPSHVFFFILFKLSLKNIV